MLFTVITPNYNSGRFLEQTIRSVIDQRRPGIELEYIMVDGNSTDNSHEIINKYSNEFSEVIIESDAGPANAINKGFDLARGDVVSWLNADDIYYPGTLERVSQALITDIEASVCFGSCPIIDSSGKEIRDEITRLKEFFYPLSSCFTYQCINYLSQPALFFRKSALDKAGMLREDMVAAWDYDLMLKLWHWGTAVRVEGRPLAAFRWHEKSISGRNFSVQFKEEYEAARNDAGVFSPQTVVHFFVRWGIVGIYSLMSAYRKFVNKH